MNEQLIEEVEVSIQEAKAVIALAEALGNLHNNKDFQLVILEGYFKNHASDLVMSKAAPGLSSDEAQKAITKSIDSIGELNQYFSKTYHSGQIMQRSLADSEMTREELMAEGLI